ncbi:hypothetical protein [Macrococcus equipercicus]|uniref:Uncharacterized protein n=1 Tax=Macrococcus equipercicus TaxID=69967 RepID=A0A9Q9BQB5_9STAP|nr:hypothetical protein [Macrococcus equipercicus]UTH14745.1 hypothetical protein KFV11_05175 [Macrococcus equipercicus]
MIKFEDMKPVDKMFDKEEIEKQILNSIILKDNETDYRVIHVLGRNRYLGYHKFKETGTAYYVSNFM